MPIRSAIENSRADHRGFLFFFGGDCWKKGFTPSDLVVGEKTLEAIG